MKAERTHAEDPIPSRPEGDDESPTAKIRRLHPVKLPYAWDPYEVWRTRVKPQDREPSGNSPQ